MDCVLKKDTVPLFRGCFLAKFSISRASSCFFFFLNSDFYFFIEKNLAFVALAHALARTAASIIEDLLEIERLKVVLDAVFDETKFRGRVHGCVILTSCFFILAFHCAVSTMCCVFFNFRYKE